MKSSFLTLFILIQFLCSASYADVEKHVKDDSIPLENEISESKEIKSGQILVNQNSIHPSSDDMYYNELIDSQKKIYELSLIIENQKKSLEKFEAKQEELEIKLTSQKITKVSMDYSNWVSLLLACVAVLVTIFGVVMAIVSFIGIRNIKIATNNIAEEVSTKVAKKVTEEKVDSQLEEITVAEISKLISDGTLRPHLEQAVDMILRSNNLIQGSSGFNQFPEIDEDIDNESV